MSDSPELPAEGHPSLATFRILDANANRAREGLRVIEEYLRFCRCHGELATRCKSLRHRLQASLDQLPRQWLIQARDAQSDVARHTRLDSEDQRESIEQVAAASFQRVFQALRALEEYGKVVDPSFGSHCKQLRYDCYGLEKALFAQPHPLHDKLTQARLYVLLPGFESARELVACAEAVLEGGGDILQLRDKTLTDRELLDRGKALRATTAERGGLLVVNDRPDLAVLLEADGVHVGQSELPVAEVRKIVGPNMLVGVSTHSIAEAEQAAADGASYLGAGPTFPTATKQFQAFPGLEFLRQVARKIALPVFAIGGVNHSNLPQVLETGIRRVAVSSALLTASDKTAATKRLRDMLDEPAKSVDR